MVKIVADSSCNLRKVNCEGLEIVPMEIYTDEKNFCDNDDLDVADMVNYLEAYKGRSYTSCPNIDAWLKAYEGADEIYVVTLTSTLSGTYNAALAALNKYKESNPNIKGIVLDTKSTGPEMHLLIIKLMELIKAGNEFETICENVSDYLKSTRLFFSLGSVSNLVKNGRLNRVIGSAINILGINIIATASEIGDIKPISKCRGDKKSATKLVSEMLVAGYNGGKMRMCHVENEALAKDVKNQILDKYPNADVDYYEATGLCSFYAERNGIIIGCETA